MTVLLSQTDRVLRALLDANGGWICTVTLRDEHRGGTRVAARVNEIDRDMGITVERKSCVCPRCKRIRAAAADAGERFTPFRAYRIPVAEKRTEDAA